MARRCSACRNQTIEFDYRDNNLSKFLSVWGRIKTRKETRLCARHQRFLATTIKRARFLALLPYTNR